MSRNYKASAWRMAADLLAECIELVPSAPKGSTFGHIHTVVIPSLRRQAERIYRRDTWAKRKARKK